MTGGADDDGGKRTDPSIPEILDLPPPHLLHPQKSILVCKNLRFLIQFKAKNQKLLELVDLLTY
jgi:hypothetical protein